MVEISIKYGNKAHDGGSIKLNKFSSKLRPNARQGFIAIGRLFMEDIKSRLEEGRPRYPNPITKTLKRSVNFKMLGDWGVEIGPGGMASAYAAIQEFGGTAGKNHNVVIPPRPYVGPSYDEKKSDAIKILQDHVFEPIR